MSYTPPDWLYKPLSELSSAQWESLCDGCGKCCMEKLQDEETNKIYYTNVACELFDSGSCRCKDYANRVAKVPHCIALSLERRDEFSWLPESCAYRLRLHSKPLPEWHPLVTGQADSTHKANASVRNKTVKAKDAGDLQYHLVQW